MHYLSEPKEIEKHLAPLSPLDGALACIPHNYQPIDIEPDDQNFIERDLYQLNPQDHQWRTKNKYFQDLPIYLTKYFAKRYKDIFKKKGRSEANKYLREKMAPAKKRAQLVLRKYSHLPNTHKIALLCEHNSEQSDFQSNQQIKFDFERIEEKAKPAKARILAELEVDELTDMAFKLSSLVVKLQDELTTDINCETDSGSYIASLMVFRRTVDLVKSFGFAPPVDPRKVTEEKVFQAISKMRDEKWFLTKLKRARKLMREHLAIAMGQVSSKASAYCSWDCVREHQDQQKKNWEFIKNQSLWEELTEEEIELQGMVLKSQANPVIRRHELMVRTRGCEDIGNAMDLQGLFLTLTAPSKYHNSYKKGGFIPHWNGASPADTQRYLNHVWQLIRSKLSNKGLRWFGVRVAEPHHDGTPHWHLLIWVQPEDVDAISEIFIDYATREEKQELIDKQGKFDHTPRCDVGLIDPEKGTATGYIAKYISKNIDGYAMDDDVSDETGKPVQEMAKHVTAWKSRWNIRQFQFFGGAPVTTYRELRRYANLDKASFLNYLTMLHRNQILQIYRDLTEDLVGPAIPDHKLDNSELFKRLGERYQPSIESNNANVVKAMQAADNGNWQDYIMGQGGPFVKRTDLLIRNAYETLPFASPHGEDVKKIEGFEAFGEKYKTRTRIWTIKPKSKVIDEAEGTANGSEATEFGASGSSRSSVNNCTEHPPEQVTNKVKRELDPLVEHEIRRLILEYDHPDEFEQQLREGRWVVVEQTNENTKSVKVLFGDGQRRPDQIVYRNEEITDLSWLGLDNVAAPVPATDEDEYLQPDLSLF
ncbi:replication endonuclease [Vibrio sp. HN007]|uniref:replication endonuclease n=1 Tax=Vibrio iocasae TaxID=3098914 RepID=UPI0035D4F6F6